MMAPLFVVIGIINILANTKNYGINIDNPETRDIRVRRDIHENVRTTKLNELFNNAKNYGQKRYKRQLSLYTPKYSSNRGHSTPKYNYNVTNTNARLDWNFVTQNNGMLDRNNKGIRNNATNSYNNWRANYARSSNNNIAYNNSGFNRYPYNNPGFNGYRYNNTGFNGYRYNNTGFNGYRYNNIGLNGYQYNNTVNYTTIRNTIMLRYNATNCRFGNTYPPYNCNYTGYANNNTGFRYPIYNYNYTRNTNRFNYGNIYPVYNQTGYGYNNNGNWNSGFIYNLRNNASQTYPIYNINHTDKTPRYNGYSNTEPNIPVYNYQDPTRSSFSGYYGSPESGNNYYNVTIKPYAPGYLPIPDFNGINNVNTSAHWYNGVNFTSSPFEPGYGTSYGDNGTVISTTEKILSGCIICNIGCPTGKHRSGIFCVPDDYNPDY